MFGPFWILSDWSSLRAGLISEEAMKCVIKLEMILNDFIFWLGLTGIFCCLTVEAVSTTSVEPSNDLRSTQLVLWSWTCINRIVQDPHETLTRCLKVKANHSGQTGGKQPVQWLVLQSKYQVQYPKPEMSSNLDHHHNHSFSNHLDHL